MVKLPPAVKEIFPEQEQGQSCRIYNRTKKTVTNPFGIGGKSKKFVKPQNEGKQTTAKKLADEYGVSEKTIRRDGQYAEVGGITGRRSHTAGLVLTNMCREVKMTLLQKPPGILAKV